MADLQTLNLEVAKLRKDIRALRQSIIVPSTTIIIYDNVTTDFTIQIPVDYVLEYILVRNNTANDVIGGLRLGTGPGEDNIFQVMNVGANSKSQGILTLPQSWPDASPFNYYFTANTSWNEANLTVYLILQRLT